MILPIKGKWFKMIASREKPEEYREIKPYWRKRFQTIGLLDRYGLPVPGTHEIIFRNGYSSKSPSMSVDCSLDIRTGRPEWGAEPEKEYYVLRIEKIRWVKG